MGGVRQEGILLVDDIGGGGGPGVAVDITGPLGPNTAADSVSVTLATDQIPLEVSSSPTVRTASGTLDAVGERVSIDTTGMGVVGFEISGTFTGLELFSIVKSGGSNDLLLAVNKIDQVYQPASNTITDIGQYVANVTGQTEFSIYVSAIASGSVLVELYSTGINVPLNVPVVLQDATNQRFAEITAQNALKVDASGTQLSTQTTLLDEDGLFPVDTGTTAPAADALGLTVRVAGTVDTELPTAAALADNVANPTVPGVGAFGMVYDGTTWDRARGDSVNGLLVNLGSNNDIVGTVTANISSWPTVISQGGTTYNSLLAGPSMSLVPGYNLIIAEIIATDFVGTVSLLFDGAGGLDIVNPFYLNLETGRWSNEPIVISVSGGSFINHLSIPNTRFGSFRLYITSYTSGSVFLSIYQNVVDAIQNCLTNEDLRAAPLDIQSTDLDIRNLTFANDKVDASGSAITLTKATTGTQTQVPDSATNVTILAANSSRLGATILNTSTVTLYLRLSSNAATTSNYTVALVANAYYEVPFWYSGQITGIWASDPGTGNANVTELT